MTTATTTAALAEQAGRSAPDQSLAQDIQNAFGGTPVSSSTPVGDGATITTTTPVATIASQQHSGQASSGTGSTTGSSSTENTGSLTTDPLINAIVVMAERLSQDGISEMDQARYTQGIEIIAGVIARDAISSTSDGTNAEAPENTPIPPVWSEADASAASTMRMVEALVAVAGAMGGAGSDAEMGGYTTAIDALAGMIASDAGTAANPF